MPKLHIYATHATVASTGKGIPRLLKKLPPSMHDRALRYKREADAYNFICGRLLLREGLKDLQIAEDIEQIQFEESGKPFLDSVFFNISHTGGLVACALSPDGRLGIDVEKAAEVELASFKAWFTPTEWKAIHAAPVPRQRFYRYWTRKESIIKALGLKLSDLNQIPWDIAGEVFEADGKVWYLGDLALGAGYRGAICSEVELSASIQLKYINFWNI